MPTPETNEANGGWDSGQHEDEWSDSRDRRPWIDKALYSVLVVAVLVFGALLAFHFLNKSKNAAIAEAKAACVLSDPALPSQNPPKSYTYTYGEVLKHYESAEADAATAAAKDPRWDSLDSAYGTEVSYWSAIVSITGADFNPQKDTNYWTSQIASIGTQMNGNQADTIVRTQCAVAQAS